MSIGNQSPKIQSKRGDYGAAKTAKGFMERPIKRVLLNNNITGMKKQSNLLSKTLHRQNNSILKQSMFGKTQIQISNDRANKKHSHIKLSQFNRQKRLSKTYFLDKEKTRQLSSSVQICQRPNNTSNEKKQLKIQNYSFSQSITENSSNNVNKQNRRGRFHTQSFSIQLINKKDQNHRQPYIRPNKRDKSSQLLHFNLENGTLNLQQGFQKQTKTMWSQAKSKKMRSHKKKPQNYRSDKQIQNIPERLLNIALQTSEMKIHEKQKVIKIMLPTKITSPKKSILKFTRLKQDLSGWVNHHHQDYFQLC